MAIGIQVRASSGSSGGGGGDTTNRNTQQFTQTANFTAGLTLALSQSPISIHHTTVDYNGRVLQRGTEYSLMGNVVTILFADPDVTTYDTNPYFQVNYEYNI